MNKLIRRYICQECGTQYPRWSGRCDSCNSWNTITEEIQRTSRTNFATTNLTTRANSLVPEILSAPLETSQRTATTMQELDRVLGGGLVNGSVVLLGGDPGIGKSTLLLQVASKLSARLKCFYITGEEALDQIRLRGQRLRVGSSEVFLLAATNVFDIIETLKNQKTPTLLVIDSIQTIYNDALEAAPGTVSQVRSSAHELIRFAKVSNTILILVGHVTKEGGLAGPKILEHMIDTFIMLDNSSDGRYRILRGHKNRFGAVIEIGVFAMTDHGMREVPNPSAIFLQRGDFDASGSVTTVTWEGTRSLLVEIQALADDSPSNQPRRIAVGLDHQRLSMQLAIMHRHCAISLSNQDVFINVVGGVRIQETGSDLALVLAVLSSLNNRPLPRDLVTFGEVGLTGELRPVVNGQERLREASKHGFKKAIVPFANQPKDPVPGLSVYAVKHLSAALEALEAI